MGAEAEELYQRFVDGRRQQGSPAIIKMIDDSWKVPDNIRSGSMRIACSAAAVPWSPRAAGQNQPGQNARPDLEDGLADRDRIEHRERNAMVMLAAAPTGAGARKSCTNVTRAWKPSARPNKALQRELDAASPDLARFAHLPRRSPTSPEDLGLVPGRHRTGRRQDRRQTRNLAEPAGLRRQAPRLPESRAGLQRGRRRAAT